MNLQSHSRRSRAPFETRASRRQFLHMTTGAAAGMLLANCRPYIANVQSGNTPRTSGGFDPDTLEIYSWAAYIDDEVVAAFKEKTGLDVIVSLYDSNEAMLAKLQAGGGRNFSIIYPSDYMIQEMQRLDLLLPLDTARIDGLDNLLPNWQNPIYDPNNAHSIPFSWGTTGLTYKPDTLKADLTDWEFLWQNQATLTRKITLLSDVREVMGAALKSLGYSYNSTDPQQIEAAYQKLLAIRSELASFTTDAWRDELLAGDIYIAMAYSSDALSVIDEDPSVNYVIPHSGASLWTDTIAIPKTAPNVDAAYEWINFMLEPENAALSVEKFKFATPVKSAFDLLSADLKANAKLFPPEEILAKCETIAPVDEVVGLYDEYWTKLTSL